MDNFRERIIYSDNHLLAVNKPAGMLTQESGSGRESLEDFAREWVRLEKSKKGAVFLHALHRLDQPVSGIVLFARTSKALSRLQERLRNREHVRKIYHAWVSPAPALSADERIDFIRKKEQQAIRVSAADPAAKKAILRYRTMTVTGDRALLEIELLTGRYHQIRCQLAAIGSPIIGDRKYGSTVSDKNIRLHHQQLEILHPTLQKKVVLVAPAAWA
jgi:23S rRNA pseudouridine1911/1915/1917 synthase